MADVWYENFKRDIVEAIEENMPAMDSDKANDIAWDIAQAFAWQIWAEVQHRAALESSCAPERGKD